MKLLIIEDDARKALLIKQGLEEQGHIAVVAYDGMTGKKLAL